MKKITLFVILLTLAGSVPAQAQFLGHLRSAESLGWGSLNLQPAAGIYEDAFSLTGRLRYGIGSMVDLTFDLGLLDFESTDDPELIVGGGVFFQLSDHDLGSPLDMSVGGFFEYFSLDRGRYSDRSDLALGVSFAISRPLVFETGFRVTPYGEANLRVDRVEVGGDTDNDFNIGFNIGAVVPVSGTVELSAEAQMDDQFGFLAAVGFLLW
jgi:hypothetical protein